MSAQNDLSKVQNLYLLQVELWNVLDGRVRSPDKVKDAKKKLREFSTLLKQVDWRYMGGEDVYEELEETAEKVQQKLSTKK